ncbi:MAG: peptidase S41 [Sphingobacteriales bacterium]|nr:MAG: peptidase S41 [Sphingobacteriales bacterium]
MSMAKLFSYLFTALVCCLLASCAGSKKLYNPAKKYAVAALQKDYRIFQQLLEDAHPSVYWYTSKDSMDYYFNYGYQQLTDSMTEPQFRTLLSYVISKINCGHTVVKYSKAYSRYMNTARLPVFPLSLKFWKDSAVVYSNINRRDSAITRGALVTAIDGVPIQQIRDSLFQYMATDGYSANHKYQSLSNIGSFAGWYKNIYGLKNQWQLQYTDTNGIAKTSTLHLYDVAKDSFNRRRIMPQSMPARTPAREQRINATRNLQIDTVYKTAYLTVTTFANGNKLKRFFKQSFQQIKQHQIKNLVIDLRSNGGGNVLHSTALTRYVVNKKFKLADSLYATRRLSKYERHIQNSWMAFFFMHAMTKKHKDGHYHFGYYERRSFKPYQKNHYSANTYVLIGGNSFSATTLFVNAIKGQKNVTVVGEETGGGAYGNTAWFIPDATLPVTKIRFRLPRFRMVMDASKPKDGRGIIPDVTIWPTQQSIKKGVDLKLEYIRQLIYGK